MPTFDIFRGHYRDKYAVWIEAVEGLAAAQKRMEEIAAERPDAYFVFSIHDRLVLAVTDTTAQSEAGSQKSKNAGAA